MGRALTDIEQEGQALIHGEIWAVQARTPIAAHTPIKVVGTLGLLLEVEEDKSLFIITYKQGDQDAHYWNSDNYLSFINIINAKVFREYELGLSSY